MKRIVALLVMMAFLGMTGPIAAVSESATMYMEKALKKRGKGDYFGAVSLLQMAIRVADRASQRILAQFMLGDCLMTTGKYREAKSVFEDALLNGARGEEEAEARFRIAQCYSHLGEPEKMAGACRELIAKFARSPYSELAKSLQQSAVAPTPAPTSPPTLAPAAEPIDESLLDEAFRRAPDPKPAARVAPVAPSASTDIRIEPGSGMVAGRDDQKPAPRTTASVVVAPVAVTNPSPKARSSTPSPSPTRPEPRPEVRRVSRPEPASSGTPSATLGDSSRLLSFPNLSLTAREELATAILQDQTALDPKRRDQDDLLFRLASRTALFGEHLEACKLYDQLLSVYPRSAYVEDAYFEAIRLRVVLRAYDPALTWMIAFRQTFPRSSLLPALEQLAAAARARKRAAASAPKPSAASSRALADPRYREAKRKLENQRFSLALADFQALVRQYPDSPKMWHELAIVQYQLQKLGDAETSLNNLLALDPEETVANEARSLRGHIYYLQGKVQKAVDEYKAAGKNEAPGLDYFNSESAAVRIGKSRGGKQR